MSKFHIPEATLYICMGSKCSKRGNKELYKNLKSHLKKEGMEEIELIKTECTDRCKFAPVLSANPGNIWLSEYTSKDIYKLLDDLKKRL